MAHIFDVMAKVNGQLNIISEHYFGISDNLRSMPKVPSFLIVSINRSIDTQKNVLIDETKAPEIDIAIRTNANDLYNPIYICVAENLAVPIVDKVPVMINTQNASGPGVGYVVIVPKKIFEQSTKIDEISKILKDMYFSILDFDPNMQYKAEPAIIRLSESDKVRIMTYDITMIYAALGFVNINLRSWFSNNGSTVSATHTVDAFTDKELSKSYKKRVAEVLDEFATDVPTLREGVGKGDMIRRALYED